MTAEDVLKLIRADPFVPLRIHMEDGRAIDISSPYGILVSRTALEVGRNPDADGVFEGADFYHIQHIGRIERLSPALDDASAVDDAADDPTPPRGTMNPEVIRDLLAVRPFEPLRVHMTDGRTVDVDTYKGVLLSRMMLTIARNPNKKEIYTAADHCPVAYIARVERKEHTSAARG